MCKLKKEMKPIEKLKKPGSPNVFYARFLCFANLISDPSGFPNCYTTCHAEGNILYVAFI